MSYESGFVLHDVVKYTDDEQLQSFSD